MVTLAVYYAAELVLYATLTPGQYGSMGTPAQNLPMMLPSQFSIVAVSQFAFAAQVRIAPATAVLTLGLYAVAFLTVPALVTWRRDVRSALIRTDRSRSPNASGTCPAAIGGAGASGTGSPLGGAVSLDRADRTPGTSWWPQEEISPAQAAAVIEGGPADVMVTHDCPAGVEHTFPPLPSWRCGRAGCTSRAGPSATPSAA